LIQWYSNCIFIIREYNAEYPFQTVTSCFGRKMVSIQNLQ